MTVDEILKEGRRIWGNEKMELSDIIVCMGKVFGDICRYERNAPKDKATHKPEDLKKELGNMIVSITRWCDDLGYDPHECISLALKAQEKFVKENR